MAAHHPVPIEATPETTALCEMVGVTSEHDILLTMAGAAPALDLVRFKTLVEHEAPTFRPGSPIVVAEPPYTNTKDAKIYDDHRYSAASVATFDPNTLWAQTKSELMPKINDQLSLRAAKDELVASHPLGEGGLLLVNGFGGIDVEDPETSARHLIVRTIIAGDAQLETVKELAQAGLMHPLLGELMPDDIAKLLDDIGKVIDVVSMLPDSSRAAAGPALFEGAVQQATGFIEAHRDEILLAANILKDPKLAAHILKLLPETRNLDAIRSVSGLNTELARHVFKLLNS